MFSCEFCEISKSTFCYRTPPVVAPLRSVKCFVLPKCILYEIYISRIQFEQVIHLLSMKRRKFYGILIAYSQKRNPVSIAKSIEKSYLYLQLVTYQK